MRARRRSLLALALVEALLGREIDCREHVKQGLDGRREYGACALEASGGLALGLLELSLARPAEAIAALEPVRRHARQAELQDPGWLPWETALIESYLAAARPRGRARGARRPRGPDPTHRARHDASCGSALRRTARG